MSSREFQVEREEHANTVFHESPCAMSQPQESPRSSRSNSLKPQSQIFLFPSRPKRRTLSLPSKPIIPPHIIIQGCHNNNDTQSEEEEKERSEVKKENMAWYTPLVGLSCSLVVYFLACALTYYSSRWHFFYTCLDIKRNERRIRRSTVPCSATILVNVCHSWSIQWSLRLPTRPGSPKIITVRLLSHDQPIEMFS